MILDTFGDLQAAVVDEQEVVSCNSLYACLIARQASGCREHSFCTAQVCPFEIYISRILDWRATTWTTQRGKPGLVEFSGHVCQVLEMPSDFWA
eukprot:1145617-Pelagomonas_calceolata.AAC.4